SAFGEEKMPLRRRKPGNPDLGKLMRQLRKNSRNPKQEFVARDMRIKTDTLSEFEKGTTLPYGEDIESFSNALGLNSADRQKLRTYLRDSRANLLAIAEEGKEETVGTVGLDGEEVQSTKPSPSFESEQTANAEDDKTRAAERRWQYIQS